jgi:phosphoesterase RecJ-like protein
MTDKALHDIIGAFRGATNVLVTGHRDPDGDLLGSQLALCDYLRSLGKGVVICDEGMIPTRYVFLEGIEEIRTDCSDLDFEPDLVVVLESTSLERIGAAKDLIPRNCTVINIDHHIGNEHFGHINLVRENASSVAEVLFGILKLAGFRVRRATAEKLYTAILTDTGRFRFSSTTPESLRICAELIEAGVSPRELTDRIYFSKSPEEMQIIGEVISTAEVLLDGRLCALTLSSERLAERGLGFSDFEGIVDYSMYLRGITIGALFKSVSASVTKVSLRSRNAFDVSELARRLGGGGHVNAAGVTIELPLERARLLVLGAAEEMLNHREK